MQEKKKEWEIDQEEPEERIHNLRELRRRVRIPHDWDIILVGDGSGTGWDRPAGWAGYMLERDRDTEKVRIHAPFVGGVNRGSINWVEAMPYWHMLRHHYHQLGGAALERVAAYVVTDSEWAAKAMSGEFRLKSHNDMFVLFKWFKSNGYEIVWNHLKRETVVLNTLADQLAALGREYMSFKDAPTLKGTFLEEV